MIPKSFVLTLFLLALLVHSTEAHYRHYKKRVDCSRCKKGSQCRSGKCWGNPPRCVSGKKYRHLVKCGFKEECEICKRSSQCATRKCWGPGNGAPKKCTYDTKESRSKCYPLPKKALCAVCKDHHECESGKCWGIPRKCTPVKDNYDQLVKCGFKKECETCDKEFECATKKCWGPGNGAPKKCTYDTKESRSRCYPPPKKPLCAVCKDHHECESGKCWGIPRKCTPVKDNYDQLVKCGFKKECEICEKEFECATKKCLSPGNGAPKKCTYDTKESTSKCYPPPKKPLCAVCKDHHECESGKCWGIPRKCTPVKDNYDQLVKCGFKKECETCEKEFECATKKCLSPGNGAPKKCAYDTKESRSRCFPPLKKPDCTLCGFHAECASGMCWGSPGRCLSPTAKYERLLQCGFKKHCERCINSLQCATKACKNYKCVYHRRDKSCSYHKY